VGCPLIYYFDGAGVEILTANSCADISHSEEVLCSIWLGVGGVLLAVLTGIEGTFPGRRCFSLLFYRCLHATYRDHGEMFTRRVDRGSTGSIIAAKMESVMRRHFEIS
jgi:hypothetical protein